MSLTRKLRWGIISTAKIATKKVIPAMQKSKYANVVGIASRTLSHAKATAKDLNIPHYYASYDELLADPSIEAIYNPLPNHLHVPLSIKALHAGKHVLCEKPIAVTSQEAQDLLDISRNYPDLKIMEAFMYRYHPQWQQVATLVQNGNIGTLKMIHTMFSYFNDHEHDIRNQKSTGGGGLLDIGCYAISLARLLFAKEPLRVQGLIETHPHFDTDVLTSAMLDFGSGFSTFTCSTLLSPYQNVQILGDRGRIEIEVPFNTHPDRSCKIIHQNQEGSLTEILFEACDQFTILADLFSQSVLENTPVPMPLSDAVHNMKVLEAIIQSSKSNQWENLN